MDKKELKFISGLFPFVGLSEKRLCDALAFCSPVYAEYASGEVIFHESEYQSKIGFIVSGKCEVVRPRCDDGISLNLLSRGASFGVISIFSENAEFPTRIIAKTASKILFFTRDEMLTLVNSYSEISLNVIRFLTDRIAFLNKKISTFSEKSTMQRLCSYLIGEYEKHGEVIPFSPTKISAKINVGRASVYRDTARLVELGYAEVDDKTIILKCPMGLERILK